ncbi:N-6 DNA methylase [Curtobacterium sp. RHCKG23]|uniref:N-6 DNA methylase n=1 Tax=Curtobacterium citri TaxID=3055139 RepID=A0ABT7T735_9MICO|nr:N-6 DNA methylase [Curtobacterium citri]MDM7885184.1 N-6 DNA methylase [Curtobacterium citri]
MLTHKLARESDTPSARKQRGAFFTPPAIAEHLVSWALDGGSARTILDPTCGDGEFLRAADRVLAESQAASSFAYWGIDLHGESLDVARKSLAGSQAQVNLLERDVFTVEPDSEDGVPRVDVVVGNPPFIRFQEHKGESRRSARNVAQLAGVQLSGLASSWAATLVHASRFLKPSGRLAMVLPAELLTVSYAAPVREWLRNRFRSVNIVLFDKLQFPGTQADVILLLAEGAGSCETFSLWPVQDGAELQKIKPYSQVNVNPGASDKWGSLLVPRAVKEDLGALTGHEFQLLSDVADLRLGAVTGANSFFVMTDDERQAWNLKPGVDVRRLSPSIKNISGETLTDSRWRQARDHGLKVWLFWPRGSVPSYAAARYIAHGEKLKIHEGYKCRNREPWWRTPVPEIPDFFLSYMSHKTLRVVANASNVVQLNSTHGFSLKTDLRGTPEASQLPILALNSVTQLSAEMSGRWYGGGILKVEPSEAGRVLLPAVDTWRTVTSALEDEDRRLKLLIKAGEYDQITQVIDRLLLGNLLGISPQRIEALQIARSEARTRRIRRG